jgi:hypothetical protein
MGGGDHFGFLRRHRSENCDHHAAAPAAAAVRQLWRAVIPLAGHPHYLVEGRDQTWRRLIDLIPLDPPTAAPGADR